MRSLNFETRTEKGAVPEYMRTKREILHSRGRAKQAMENFNREQYLDQFDTFRMAVISFYQDLEPFIEVLEHNGKDYSDLDQLKYKPDKHYDSYKDVTREDVKEWKEYFYRLNELLFDLGITDIALDKSNQPYGYSFMNGLDFNLKKNMPGWQRLKANLKNMRRLMKKDVDIVGVVYGSNRSGKTTLSLQCADIVQYGEARHELPQDHMIINEQDFDSKFTPDLEERSALHLDEISLLLHYKDSMDNQVKNRTKKFKTYSKLNPFVIGCENNIFNINKEFLGDKVKFAIEVPERGRFKFFSKRKLKKFEKQKDSNYPDTPEPDFTGRFPNLDPYPETGKRSPLWETYLEVEDKKLEVGEEEEEDEIDIGRYTEVVVENSEDFKKELEGRDPIISHRLIQGKFGHQEPYKEFDKVSENKAKILKDNAENELDW